MCVCHGFGFGMLLCKVGGGRSDVYWECMLLRMLLYYAMMLS